MSRPRSVDVIVLTDLLFFEVKIVFVLVCPAYSLIQQQNEKCLSIFSWKAFQM